MKLTELLSILLENGIRLDESEGRLRLIALNGPIPGEIRGWVRDNKEELLSSVRQQQRAPTVITPAPAEYRYRPSFGQERLLFLDTLRPYSSAYNVASALHLRGPLDADLLSEAINWLTDRHECLRTYFQRSDDSTHALISRIFRPDLPVLDLSALNEHQKRNEYDDRCRKIAAYGFDLAELPLWRTELIKLGAVHHALLVSLHHSIGDGWSLALALRELAVYYKARLAGRKPELNDPPICYSDFAKWQRGWLDESTSAGLFEYWSEHIRGFPESLRLPTDRPRPPIQSDLGETHRFELGPKLEERVRRFAADQGVSLPILFLAAFATLLYRYSAQDRFIVGTAISNRPRPELQNVFGFFVNWLPMPSDFQDSPTFDQLLRNFYAASLRAYENQDLPFDEIVRRLHLSPNPSHHPLFNTMLVFHVPARDVDLGLLDGEISPISTRSAKLDLTLFVTDTRNALPIVGNGDFHFEFEYCTALFEPSTIERFAASFVCLLENLMNEPFRPVSEIPMVSRQDSKKLLARFNGKNVTRPPDTLHGLFESQVNRTPDASALQCGNLRVTYGELGELATLVSDKLISCGVGPGMFVGILLDRSVDLVASILGVLRAGAAYVPLDPSYPVERLRFMISDANPKVILTTRTWKESLSEDASLMIDVKEVLDTGLAGTFSQASVGPGDYAYLLYTSGSTGEPKGVLCRHESVVNFVLWLNEWLSASPDDKVLFKASISFDASIRELFAPLAAGSCIVLVPPDANMDIDVLQATLEREKITIMHAVPTMYRALLGSGPLNAPALRHVVCGGEVLSPELVLLHDRNTNAQLHNVYGPTEATVDVLAWHCSSGAGCQLPIVPVGHPIDNSRIYILDSGLNPVQAGAIGEIYIGGLPVAQGYWHRPALSAERFIPDPFTPEGQATLFKTGDLGRELANGAIAFEGRSDTQIKLRGFRIELQEIETVLNQHPAVARCAVTTNMRSNGDQAIIAYVQPTAGANSGGSDHDPSRLVNAFREFLTAGLPGYMVPGRFVIVPDILVQPNGKTDYAALTNLKETFQADPDDAGELTELEQLVSTVFAGVLGTGPLSRNDDFFLLGGHSLLATQVASRLRTLFTMDVTVRDVLECRTVGRLAETLSTRARVVTDYQEPILPALRPQ